MKTSWRSASLVASAAAVLALTTACGQESAPSTGSQNVGATAPAGDYGSVGAGVGTGTGASPQAGQSSAATQTSTAGELSVSDNAELGEVLTDSAGLTLYRFDQDTAEPPKTNCEADCATTWPPVPADDATAGAGIDKALLGEVTRPDGTKQLTVGGWPAYRYAKDTKAGDVAGQGVGGKWYALAPDGKKAKQTGAGQAEQAGLPGLSTRNDPELGEIVIDKNGMTVYRFMKDTQWPMSTACTDKCLEKWPVVAPVDAEDTKGIDLQGSTANRGYVVFDRPDGVKQQSIDCVPIYTFAGDKKPGDTNGQGVGGTWYAVAPDGKPVGAPDKS
jgi:predicted lipoprotein with Yx(FWY)xxD motif